MLDARAVWRLRARVRVSRPASEELPSSTLTDTLPLLLPPLVLETWVIRFTQRIERLRIYAHIYMCVNTHLPWSGKCVLRINAWPNAGVNSEERPSILTGPAYCVLRMRTAYPGAEFVLRKSSLRPDWMCVLRTEYAYYVSW